MTAPAETLSFPLGDVTPYDTAQYLGYLFGTILHGALVVVIARRREKEGSERVFLWLAAALLVWFGGQTLALLFRQPEPHEALRVTRVFHVISGVGLVLSPSLLLHTLMAFSADRFQPLPRRTRRVLLALLYLPVLYYGSAGYDFAQAGHEEGFVAIARTQLDVFAYHSLAYYGVFAVALIEIARRVERRDERRFFRALAGMVLLNGLLIYAAFPWGDRLSPPVRDSLQLLTMLSGMFPTIFFSYYIYRYRPMESLIRQSAIYVVLAAFILLTYQFAIKPVVRGVGGTTLNATAVETFLLLFLFAGLGGFAKSLRWFFQNVLGRRFVATRDAVRELSRRMSLFTRADLRSFLELLEERVHELLRVQPVRIVLTDPRVSTVRGAWREGFLRESDSRAREQVQRLLAYWEEHGFGPLDLYERPPSAIAQTLVQLSSEYVLPIRGEAGAVLGIVSAGRRAIYSPLLPDEKELLALFVNQLAVVIEHLFGTEEKMNLQRKMIESEKLATLGTLSASVAHEVRNPLSSMKSILTAWRDAARDRAARRGAPVLADLADDLDLVIAEIDRLARVVNQLLAFSRESSRGEARAPLAGLLDDLRVMAGHEATAHGVRLSVECPADLAALPVPASPLKEALLNLVLNGIQAIERTGAVVVRARREDGELVVEVEDSGPGIPPELRERVLEPFFTTKTAGTGLGLAIVADRVGQMGGSFRLEEGLPTTATLRLSLEALAEPDGARPSLRRRRDRTAAMLAVEPSILDPVHGRPAPAAVTAPVSTGAEGEVFAEAAFDEGEIPATLPAAGGAVPAAGDEKALPPTAEDTDARRAALIAAAPGAFADDETDDDQSDTQVLPEFADFAGSTTTPATREAALAALAEEDDGEGEDGAAAFSARPLDGLGTDAERVEGRAPDLTDLPHCSPDDAPSVRPEPVEGRVSDPTQPPHCSPDDAATPPVDAATLLPATPARADNAETVGAEAAPSDHPAEADSSGHPADPPAPARSTDD